MIYHVLPQMLFDSVEVYWLPATIGLLVGLLIRSRYPSLVGLLSAFGALLVGFIFFDLLSPVEGKDRDAVFLIGALMRLAVATTFETLLFFVINRFFPISGQANKQDTAV